MNKNLAFIGLALVGVTVIVLAVGLRSSKSATRPTSSQGIAETTSQATNQEISPTNTANWYTDYSPAALAQAATENKKTVIFFHASWCPTCQAASKDFEANKAQIPADITILKANYDIETELKKKYNVVGQDTFVQVDAKGNEVAKWNSGGEGIKTLLTNLQ